MNKATTTGSKKIIKTDQRGLVSMIVAVVLMVVLSLVVLSFAALSRREQRQTLDRQLATQATYAAESGINDAIKALTDPSETLKNGLASGKDYAASCSDFMLDAGLDGTLDETTSVSYTCVQVNPAPGDLQYKNVNTNSRVIPLQMDGGGAVQELTVSWDGAEGGKSCSRSADQAATFPTPDAWNCDMGVLRLDLAEIRDNGMISNGDSRAHLENNTATFFLSPTNGGTNEVTYASGQGFQNQGRVAVGSCSDTGTPRACSVKITGMSGSRYYARLKSIYRNSDVTIVASNGKFTGAQAVVDVTGKANDILRRLQVRVASGGGGFGVSNLVVPEFGLQSAGTICKKLEFSGDTPTVADSDAACQLNAASAGNNQDSDPPGNGRNRD